MIEVVVRHEYHEPEYLVECYQCKSILKFIESDTVFCGEGYYPIGYYLDCPVCGFTNSLGSKRNWDAETERLKGEL